MKVIVKCKKCGAVLSKNWEIKQSGRTHIKFNQGNLTTQCRKCGEWNKIKYIESFEKAKDKELGN